MPRGGRRATTVINPPAARDKYLRKTVLNIRKLLQIASQRTEEEFEWAFAYSRKNTMHRVVHLAHSIGLRGAHQLVCGPCA